MLARITAVFEPFVLALIVTVLLASILPARGQWVPIMDGIAAAGIVLLFFLHGAKLSREAIFDGVRAWRLHLTTLAITFALFPILGLGASSIPGVPATMTAGMLFLTLLPSTVQSSIAFTAIARGNVAAAVCSAAFSTLLGILLTPLLVTLLMQNAGLGFSTASVEKIVLQLLLPFLFGHLARPLIGGFVARHKALVAKVDRGSILLVVYTAFGAAVVEGIWQRISAADLGILAVICSIMLAIVLGASALLGKVLGFSREDATALLFCGSKKSLASGVPMAGVLFPAAQVGMLILPLMVFHQIQLIVCAIIARRLATNAEPQ